MSIINDNLGTFKNEFKEKTVLIKNILIIIKILIKIILIITFLFSIYFNMYFNYNKSNNKTKIMNNKNIYGNEKISQNISQNNYNNINNIQFNNIYTVINKLKSDYKNRNPQYILLFDFFINKYCNDLNSYLIFKYYQQKNKTQAYYIINNESFLYKSLLKKNETNNLIPINPLTNYWNKLYNFILNSKIIVQSYIFIDFQILISQVNYLKYLKINHGVRYFKKFLAKYELKHINISKFNTIITSPYEYDIYKNKFHLNDDNLFKAGLPRFDRFNNLNISKTNKKCILIAFTYRSYNNKIYEISLFKKNLENLFEDQNLISFLKIKNIDLIYIPHHFDILRKRPFNPKKYPYIKYKKQNDLSYYIEQCSLCVTDFSSISFDFMFQNKPTLFYLIDLNDSINFLEKKYMNIKKKENIYFGNVFIEKKKLIQKIKYYINNNFNIGNKLKKKYQSLFYYKKNITKRIVEIIDKIITKN